MIKNRIITRMNIVLTCINNFQEYIVTNIEQLIRLNHSNIYVITNKQFSHHFTKFNDTVKLFYIEDLDLDGSVFKFRTNLDSHFRGGFWMLTSYRFFVIYEFMKKYNISNVIHLENDVLIYYNCDELLGKVDNQFMYMPFDSNRRNIASIVYIPDHEIYEKILNKYDMNNTDMSNFRNIQIQTGLIRNFPIFKTCDTTDETKFVTANFDTFKFIFDAAAMGQYLGGVDPANVGKNVNTIGFVNDTCIIKYNNYSFEWVVSNNINRPFIKIDDVLYPIFNLHIHSKNLLKFV